MSCHVRCSPTGSWISFPVLSSRIILAYPPIRPPSCGRLSVRFRFYSLAFYRFIVIYRRRCQEGPLHSRRNCKIAGRMDGSAGCVATARERERKLCFLELLPAPRPAPLLYCFPGWEALDCCSRRKDDITSKAGFVDGRRKVSCSIWHLRLQRREGAATGGNGNRWRRRAPKVSRRWLSTE